MCICERRLLLLLDKSGRFLDCGHMPHNLLNDRMVNMQLSNEKLVDRGTKMVMEQLKLDDYEEAKKLLLKYGSVKKAVAVG